MKRIKPSDFYPFLISLYPILTLVSHNLDYVNINSILRSIILSILVTLILVTFLSIITKNRDKGNILTAFIMFIFFSYGQVYELLVSTFGSGVRHRYLILGFLLLFLLAGWFLLRSKSISKQLIKFLAISSLAMLLIGAYPFVTSSISSAITRSRNENNTAANSHTSEGEYPDIYVIILDSYTRADVLESIFQYDNTPFVNELRGLGFYVADCSQSNYPGTRYSLSSLMQGNYLQAINPDGSLSPFSQTTVIKALRARGYSVYAFENRSRGHFELGEDKLFSRNNPSFGFSLLHEGLNEFESMLFKTTVFRILSDMPQLAPNLDLVQAEYYEHFQQVKYTLAELPKLPELPGPKFVLVHILVPHEPYIFSADGNYKYTADVYKGYLSNVSYLNNELPTILNDIINKSKTLPIIIVQGDHGPNLKSNKPEIRHAILNAYYVNDDTKALLYSTITPVNSFRIILDSYFNENFELISDKSYYAYGPKEMREEKLVPNVCKQ